MKPEQALQYCQENANRLVFDAVICGCRLAHQVINLHLMQERCAETGGMTFLCCAVEDYEKAKAPE